jgi:hypothetical protein
MDLLCRGVLSAGGCGEEGGARKIGATPILPPRYSSQPVRRPTPRWEAFFHCACGLEFSQETTR